MNIYITRHGETVWNTEGRCQGSKNSDLTEKGVSDARKLGERLKNVKFDCVYCSPLKRAIDTAECIMEDRNIKLVLKDELKELNFGAWEGERFSDIKGKYPVQYDNLWNNLEEYEPVEGETMEELIKRVQTFLKELFENCDADNVLVVAHTFIVRTITLIVKGYSLEKFWNPPYTGNTCLSIVEVKGDKLTIIMEADISHLNENN